MIARPFVALMAPVLVIAILIFCGTGSRALAEELDIAQGTIYITETGYQQGTSQTASTGPYIISGTGSESIVIQSGTQDITISNLQITASGKPAIRVEAGATLKLTVVGENRLTGGSGFAGICVAPAYDSDWNYDTDASGKLYLFGDGTLNVEGGDGDAVGGTYGGGAGIGGNGEDQHGGDSVDFGLVCVTEGFTGILDASGGTASAYVDGENAFGGGAGIGSGGFNMGYINNYTDISPYYWGEVVGRIELHGGTIRAHAAGNGAGIGGGGGQGEDTASSQISILISGGSIIAEGGTLGAGIGGGAICDGGRIRISSGSISATAGPSEDSMGAAGIGGGNNSSVQEVSITGGTVIARASGGAAAEPTPPTALFIMGMWMDRSVPREAAASPFRERGLPLRHTAAPAGDTPEVMAAPASVRVIQSRIKIEALPSKFPLQTALPYAPTAAIIRRPSAMATGRRIIPAMALRWSWMTASSYGRRMWTTISPRWWRSRTTMTPPSAIPAPAVI